MRLNFYICFWSSKYLFETSTGNIFYDLTLNFLMVWKSLHHLKRPSGYLNATRATGGNQQIRPRLCGRVAGQIGVLKRSDVAAGEGLKSLSHLKWPSGYLRPNCFLPSWQHVWIYFFWADNLGGLKKKKEPFEVAFWVLETQLTAFCHHDNMSEYFGLITSVVLKSLSHLKWPSEYLSPCCFHVCCGTWSLIHMAIVFVIKLVWSFKS